MSKYILLFHNYLVFSNIYYILSDNANRMYYLKEIISFPMGTLFFLTCLIYQYKKIKILNNGVFMQCLPWTHSGCHGHQSIQGNRKTKLGARGKFLTISLFLSIHLSVSVEITCSFRHYSHVPETMGDKDFGVKNEKKREKNPLNLVIW